MMPPPSPDNLTRVVNVRLTERDHARLRDEAESAGMSVSAYCRRRMLGHVVIPHTDRVVIRELRRLGGLAKQLHTQSGGAYSEHTAGALADLRAAIQRVAQPLK